MALDMALSPSFLKGRVTTATVRMPFSFAILAMIGAAPVPVPPPMPAVMKSMRVPVSMIFFSISAWLSSAALRPLMGLVPAPRPAPIWIFTGTGLHSSACESVLQTTKLHPSMPVRYM